MAWEPGQHVHDWYLIERKLGEGGFGITYLAQNPQGELKVIKTLKDKVLNNPTKYPQEREKLLQNFRKEAAILIECRHPNIVCLNNEGNQASLEVERLYRMIDDEQAASHGLIRIIDESGEDYAFSRDRFYPIALSQSPEKVLMAAS